MQARVLYSFRRCPYAMRARMALWAAGIDCELREVALGDKPDAMLALSPKGTVPILQLEDGQVLEESESILKWALQQNDPRGWLSGCDADTLDQLIAQNDGPFKRHLDRFKYSVRYDDADPDEEWQLALQALSAVRGRLGETAFLGGSSISAADIAVFPFVRQFRNASPETFAQAEPRIEAWLMQLLDSDAFKAIMPKVAVWKPGDAPVFFAHVYGRSKPLA